jgi:DNA (cytosine-5)-methyltransferase 1
MSTYYNEIDPLKAEVLREAIKAGVISPGDVDERSIADVKPDDLMGYTQCHFFAGGGFWSLALRYAGWPDDRPVWTGSCPCPSFSAAGKGGGFDDPRHLWPHWSELIRQRKPSVVFGEQADDAVGYGWVDLVQTDMEAASYAFGKVVFGACSVGAPHIRQRLYFVADTTGERQPGRWIGDGSHSECHADGPAVRSHGRSKVAQFGAVVRMGESEGSGLQVSESSSGNSAVGGFWADAEWIPCRNPKVPGGIEWRPIEPGTFPLAHGSTARVGRLRMFGDGIVVTQAQAFIEAYLDLEG